MGQFQISHFLPQHRPFFDIRFIDLPGHETTTVVEHMFLIPPPNHPPQLSTRFLLTPKSKIDGGHTDSFAI